MYLASHLCYLIPFDFFSPHFSDFGIASSVIFCMIIVLRQPMFLILISPTYPTTCYANIYSLKLMLMIVPNIFRDVYYFLVFWVLRSNAVRYPHFMYRCSRAL
ncbi:hypothetical protein BDP27DRAFT_707777 [Rhodocollybia butyracea]|uniref:Uncharacterized protein n=1 Tax=Rhodocollybia butyracea TaxID=206335 RepID=A0A9P5UF57_9AGAR|nr:hypothetical protein BDP27DRAFT_707777 [Rhodocollybia butyracea]